MTVPLRFDQLQPDAQTRIQGNLAKMVAAGAPQSDVDAYLQQVEHLAPNPHLGNAAGMLSGAAQGATFGFADEALGAIDAANALLPKALGGKGIPLSQFGQQYRATRDMIRGADKEYAGQHPLLYNGAALGGGLATALAGGGAQALKSAPTLGSKLLSALDQGIVGGATAGLGASEGTNPDAQLSDAARGAAAGAVTAPAATLAGAGLGALGKTVLNKANLRPENPITIGGKRLPINTVDEEAAQKVANAVQQGGKTLPDITPTTPPPGPPRAQPQQLSVYDVLAQQRRGIVPPAEFAKDFNDAYAIAQKQGHPNPNAVAITMLRQAGKTYPGGEAPTPVDYGAIAKSFGPESPTPQVRNPGMEIPAGLNAGKGKPQTLMELGGQPVARLARTARAASPAAGQKIDAMLEQRTAGAPDRAIQDALQGTGLQQRDSGFQLTNDLIAQRSADADAAYAPAFKDQTPVSDPRLQKIMQTDAWKRAWPRAERTMQNLGMEGSAAPAGMAPADWELLKAQGLDKYVPGGQQPSGPTLQQLHFVKLAMDDMMEPGLNRGAGEGGLGRTEGRSVLSVQKKLLNVMDDASPAYKTARQQFADQSSLVRASQLGQQLFKMKPEEAQAAVNDLGSEAEKQIFRRSGVDALADRLENGPADVERGISKPRDQRRVQLLFPDDASFQQFKDRIAKEAEMVGNHQYVSGGSQTADKLSDLSDMLGLSTVAKAATGNLSGAAKDLAGGLMKMRGQTYGSRLGEKIADLTTAGGNGDKNELARAIQRLQSVRPKGKAAIAPAVSLTAALHAPTDQE